MTIDGERMEKNSWLSWCDKKLWGKVVPWWQKIPFVMKSGSFKLFCWKQFDTFTTTTLHWGKDCYTKCFTWRSRFTLLYLQSVTVFVQLNGERFCWESRRKEWAREERLKFFGSSENFFFTLVEIVLGVSRETNVGKSKKVSSWMGKSCTYTLPLVMERRKKKWKKDWTTRD